MMVFKMVKRFKLFWLLLLLSALALTNPVYAQNPDTEVTDDDVNRVARELYCPV